ncbi:MAG: hypothetical protein O8C61_07750 [Candidatus Methanoperedens sp.]|nr:hypothetical protein [Candidatus Methanoperedens sp.]
MKPICIDANVFIASTKEDEQYSSDCRQKRPYPSIPTMEYIQKEFKDIQ